jgi:cbb3-type cytochrome oxidase subunit 3
MYRHLVEKFDLLAYPIAALLIFVAVFVFILGRALRAQGDFSALAALPLDQEHDDHAAR